MKIDTEQIDHQHPPEPECQINQTQCEGTPIEYVCHECGTPMCATCAEGLRHQPQLFTYSTINGEENERVQVHCPDCAESHTYQTVHFAAGGVGVLLGALVLFFGGLSLFTLPFGLLLLAIGVALIGGEIWLKRSTDPPSSDTESSISDTMES